MSWVFVWSLGRPADQHFLDGIAPNSTVHESPLANLQLLECLKSLLGVNASDRAQQKGCVFVSPCVCACGCVCVLPMGSQAPEFWPLLTWFRVLRGFRTVQHRSLFVL